MSIGEPLSILIGIAASASAVGLLYWIQSLIEENESDHEVQQLHRLRETMRIADQRQIDTLKRANTQDLALVVRKSFQHRTSLRISSSASGLRALEPTANQLQMEGGESRMNDKAALGKLQSRAPKAVPTVRATTLALGLMAVGFLLAACGVRADQPVTPTPTTQSIETASVEGTLWHDLCLNESTDAAPPDGCVIDATTGGFVANGVLEPGEPGLPDVRIAIGLGGCPSSGLGEVTTGADGRYVIEGLWPGEYCVSVIFGGGHQPTQRVPGVWTTPGNGMQTVYLQAGERRSDLNFGWDYFNQPAAPTPVPTPTPTPTPSCSDAAEFIRDVTIGDGARLDPGEHFTKTWRLRNSGGCDWTTDYDLVYYAGDRLGGGYVIPLSGTVEPDETVDLSVALVAPYSLGTYQGYWMLRNAEGELFGIGADASSAFWVKVLIDPEISEWRGEYFANRKLEGNPSLIRNDEEIDFNWKSEAPAAGLPADNFSARWTRELNFDRATYRFTLRVDDGVRLWVDDRLVLDEWEDGSVRTISVTLAMTKGRHDLKLEYFEHLEVARIELDIDKTSIDSGGAWLAKYWFNRDLDSEWALIGTASKVDFDWGSNSPALGIPADNFSARWSHTVSFEPGTYRLYARADDGIRLEIDGDRIIKEWHESNGSQTYTSELELSGSHEVVVEYYEHSGQAKVHVWWELLSPTNQPPTAGDDAYQVQEDELLSVPAPGILDNDVDPEGQPLQIVFEAEPAHGTLSVAEDGSFEYQPQADYNGTDQFSYRVSDGQLTSEVAVVLIEVEPVNDVPEAVDDEASGIQDQPLEIEVLANDLGLGDGPLTITIEIEPENGSVEIVDGRIVYTPTEGFIGEDSLEYAITDADGERSQARVAIVVAPVVE